MIQITGVLGVAGVPAVIPVVDTSPGHGNVIGVTVILVTRVVLEKVPRQKIVITPTKVIIVIPITIIIEMCPAGILITAYNQAEMFIPSTKETFPLPSIPGSPRVWHTLTGNILCGGVYPGTSDNCLELQQNGDGWKDFSSTLKDSRLAHSQWNSPDGVVLLGGYFSGSSTELVKSGGSISQFTLKYNIRFGSEGIFFRFEI